MGTLVVARCVVNRMGRGAATRPAVGWESNRLVCSSKGDGNFEQRRVNVTLGGGDTAAMGNMV